ncbi:glycosyltransferase family protein [Magnetospira sp. QH-2]|uniref:glycosyltransferase family protein n=1 Tax=Magnetospira sp. (strain QH-2) TaxID=1288970 RepID=UPI0003E819EE|nr:glycosyltransferase [Magnetospira sp. QH-2]CCQ74921.1 conserved protein of unknown function[Include Glycosyltransferase family 28 C-terminal domain] [Magnetospira sp. QH-2]
MIARPVLIHVQHLLGIGHIARAAAIARALAASGVETVVAHGGFPNPNIDFGGAHMEFLPPVRATDASFQTLVDENDEPLSDDWKARRRDQLLALFDAVNPGVLVTELYPFGRKSLRFELEPLIARARGHDPGTWVICSVRDILVTMKKPSRYAEMADIANRDYDRIMVHGDPTVISFESTFPYPERIQHLLTYTGYIAQKQNITTVAGLDEVLVSAGGGGRSEPLYRSAMGARALSALHDHTWRLLIGHGLPQDRFDVLADEAPEGVIVERARPDFTAMLDHCALSISQAGYNTVTDILTAGARSVLVPYAEGGETEQTLRAKYLVERDLARMVEEPDLTPQSLAAAVESALTLNRPDVSGMAMGGVAETVRLLTDWTSNPPKREPSRKR